MDMTIEKWLGQFRRSWDVVRKIEWKYPGFDDEPSSSYLSGFGTSALVCMLEKYVMLDGYLVFFESIQPRVPVEELIKLRKERARGHDTVDEIFERIGYLPGDARVVLSAIEKPCKISKTSKSNQIENNWINASADRVYHVIIDSPYPFSDEPITSSVTSEDFSRYSAPLDSNKGIYLIDRPHRIAEIIEQYKENMPFGSKVKHRVQTLSRNVSKRLSYIDNRVYGIGYSYLDKLRDGR